jgi:hypothetical protein
MVNDASRRSHDFKDELGGKPEWVGGYCERALKLHPSWKGLSGKAEVKTGIGKSDLPGLQGGPRKRDLVSYYMVRAPRLYPDPGSWFAPPGRWDEFCMAHSATTRNENGICWQYAVARRVVQRSSTLLALASPWMSLTRDALWHNGL